MTGQKITIAAVAAFALSVSPAWAGQRERPAGSESTGSAQPRGGGESSAPSSPSPSSSSGSSSSGSAGSSGSYEPPRAAPSRPSRADSDDQRRGGGASTGRAVPRGSSGNSGSTRGTGSTAGSNDSSGGNREAVPTYSRPRDGRNATGTAVERRGPAPGGGGSVYYPGVIYDPYYYGYGYYDSFYGSRRIASYWSPYGYGYGLGYFAYDPYMFGGGYPYGSGGYGYDSYGGGGGSYGTTRYGEVGSVRLKVKPNNAQVYIDGYYVGVVDSYDGAFQRLNIEAGSHRVEVRAEGYETVQFEVMVMPGETITYKGELKRIQ
jgi:hypothetical protein